VSLLRGRIQLGVEVEVDLVLAGDVTPVKLAAGFVFGGCLLSPRLEIDLPIVSHPQANPFTTAQELSPSSLSLNYGGGAVDPVSSVLRCSLSALCSLDLAAPCTHHPLAVDFGSSGNIGCYAQHIITVSSTCTARAPAMSMMMNCICT
jgi:hypothetical protein